MVYKVSPVQVLVFFPGFLFFHFLFVFNNSLHLTYILNLNYWLTNGFFIIFILFLFYRKSLTYTLILVFVLVFKSNQLVSFCLKKKLLATLMVGTITVHPIAFYIFTITFFFQIFFCKYFYKLSLLPISYKWVSIYLMFTLLLGGFWGLQSIAWGYLWVNDTVEWILLCEVLYLLYICHLYTYFKYSVNNQFIPFCLLTVILLVRLNLLQTRHNFIADQPSLLYVIVSYFFFFMVTSLVFRSRNFSCQSVKIVPTSFFFFFFIFCFTLLSLKYFWLFLCFFFYLSLYKNLLQKNLFTHIFIFSIFFSWLLFFKFFYLQYFYNHFGALTALKFYSHIFQLFLTHSEWCYLVYLEGVSFYVNLTMHHISNIMHNLSFFVYFNNSIILLFFYIVFFLLKRVELRFLHKKTTLV